MREKESVEEEEGKKKIDPDPTTNK